MKDIRLAPLLLAFATSGVLACGSDSSAPSGPDASFAAAAPSNTDSCPVLVSAATCDQNQRPILFVHGTYSSGGDIEHMAALLGSNGFCQDRIAAIDYDSVALTASPTTGGIDSPGVDCTAPNTPSGCGMIDRAIDALLQKFPQFTQVDLAGHSQGTFHCGNYLALHANKVAHYINFSGTPNVGNVPTLSLSSLRDLNLPGFPPPHHATGTSVCAFQETDDGGFEPVVPEGGVSEEGGAESGTAEGGDTEGGAANGDAATAADGGASCTVIQETLIQQDHFAVAASKDSFVQVYKFLTGREPVYTDIQCGDDPVTVEGISETFADNTPSQGTLKINEVSNVPQEAGAAVVATMDATGHFGPVLLKRNVQYVFSGTDPNGKILGWQYFSPFKRDNRLVRILSPASASDGSPVGALVAAQSTDHAVTNASTTVVVARWAQGGFRQDLGASLKVNGVEALSSDNSGLEAGMSTNLQGGVAALFLEDANRNGKTDLGLPYSTTFIAFTDVFVDASKPAFVDLTFTGGSEDPETVNIPLTIENFPSSVGFVGATFQ